MRGTKMSGRSCNRKMIDIKHLQDAYSEIMQHTENVLSDKGMGSFASRHELNGILDEEFNIELKKASHEEKQSFDRYSEELKDIATACIFGLACIKAGGMEW